MGFDVDAAVSLLWTAHIPITLGLSDDELRWNESRFGIMFGADHAALLRAAVPTGPRWPDWRSPDGTAIRTSIAWPVEGVLFDVEHNDYWHPDWDPRPRRIEHALQVANHALAAWPRQIPICGHCYQATEAPTGSPVLSIYQTDVIIYGTDLLDYLRQEPLHDTPTPPIDTKLHGSDPWLALALDNESASMD